MKGMNCVTAGDMLRPDPCWNRTTGNPEMHLPDPVRVLGVKTGKSQTGVLVTVKAKGGQTIHLDKGWFTENTSRMTETLDLFSGGRNDEN